MKRRNFFAVLAGLPLVRLAKFQDTYDRKGPGMMELISLSGTSMSPGQLIPYDPDTNQVIDNIDSSRIREVQVFEVCGNGTIRPYTPLKDYLEKRFTSYDVRNIGPGSDRTQLLKR